MNWTTPQNYLPRGMPKIGKLKHIGNGYYYQRIKLPKYMIDRGYYKVWYEGNVVDRALTKAVAKKRAVDHWYANKINT